MFPKFRYIVLFTWLGMIAVLSACVPTQTPPQLTFTPGAPIVITQHEVRTVDFVVDVPVDWRIVTAPAESASALTLVSPDEQALIYLTSDLNGRPPEFSVDGGTMVRYESKNAFMLGVLITRDETLDEFSVILEAIIDSAHQG